MSKILSSILSGFRDLASTLKFFQDVVEERFQKEYLIAIGVAAVIVSVLTTVIVILLAIKCRGIRKSRRHSYEEAKVHLYQASAR